MYLYAACTFLQHCIVLLYSIIVVLLYEPFSNQIMKTVKYDSSSCATLLNIVTLLDSRDNDIAGKFLKYCFESWGVYEDNMSLKIVV